MHARLENDSCVTRRWGGGGREARAPLKYTGFACLVDQWTISEPRAYAKREGEKEKNYRLEYKFRRLKGARHLTDSVVLHLPKGRDIYIYCLIHASLFHKSEKQL